MCFTTLGRNVMTKINNTFNNNPPAFKGGSFVVGNKTALKWVERIGGWSSPQNRVVLGVTALAIQPAIDLNNKKVDEDTRKISAARTTAKIIAGTVVGYPIRLGCIKLIDKFTDIKTAEKGWNRALIPNNRNFEEVKSNLEFLSRHKKALGTFLALGVMVFTNFILDVPITKFLTNVFNKHLQRTDEKKSAEQGGKA